MSGSLQSRFEDLFREVNASSQIEVISANAEFSPYDPKLIGELEKMLAEDYGCHVPESISELVNFPEEVSLFWEHKSSGPDGVFGEFHVENIINSVSLSKNRVRVYNEDLDDDVKDLMLRARYFDPQPSLGWNTATVLVPSRDQGAPELWFLDDSKMQPLSLDLEEYFDALFLTKGAYYWQYLFCPKAVYGEVPYFKKKLIGRVLEVLPELFPARDYSGLRDLFGSLNQ